MYMPGPDLFIAYWLSRQNHKKNKDTEIPHMQVNIDAIQMTTNIPQSPGLGGFAVDPLSLLAASSEA